MVCTKIETNRAKRQKQITWTILFEDGTTLTTKEQIDDIVIKYHNFKTITPDKIESDTRYIKREDKCKFGNCRHSNNGVSEYCEKHYDLEVQGLLHHVQPREWLYV